MTIQSTDTPPKKVYKPRGPGKVTKTAKENIIAVFIRLGSTAQMAEWARENQTEFYKLYARLIPIEHAGEGGGPVTVRHEIVGMPGRAP